FPHPPRRDPSSLLSPCLLLFFFFHAPPTTEIYTLSLHDALPISVADEEDDVLRAGVLDGLADGIRVIAVELPGSSRLVDSCRRGGCGEPEEREAERSGRRGETLRSPDHGLSFRRTGLSDDPKLLSLFTMEVEGT